MRSMSTTFRDRWRSLRAGRSPRRSTGMSIITAIFMLLLLAGVAAYMMTIASVEHGTSGQDVMGAKAYQAARAGAEWGAYTILKVASPLGFCALGGSDSFTIPAGGSGALAGELADFTVTVACTRRSTVHDESGRGVIVYRIDSTACNRSATCPAATALPGYVERQFTMTVWEGL